MPAVIDYKSAPLGTLRGEEGLQSPYNLKPTNCIVRVRNLSATKKRRIVKEAVSFARGGDESILNEKGPHFKRSGVSSEMLRNRARMGENMNWEADEIQPVDAIVTHGGRRYLIPHKDKNTNDPAPWVVVDPGAWDLYCGNWERMHSSDQREKAKEVQAFNMRGYGKWVVKDNNPYGYLEFQREEILVESVDVDSQAVKSGQIMEI